MWFGMAPALGTSDWKLKMLDKNIRTMAVMAVDTEFTDTYNPIHFEVDPFFLKSGSQLKTDCCIRSFFSSLAEWLSNQRL